MEQLNKSKKRQKELEENRVSFFELLSIFSLFLKAIMSSSCEEANCTEVYRKETSHTANFFMI